MGPFLGADCHLNLLRQYFRGARQAPHYTDKDLDALTADLNGRPRQTLEWRNPTPVFDELFVQQSLDFKQRGVRNTLIVECLRWGSGPRDTVQNTPRNGQVPGADELA
jgi:hypothetical protein